MPPNPESVVRSWPYSNRIRVAVAAGCGLVGGFASFALHFRPPAALVGWDATAAVYVAWVVATVFRLDQPTTKSLATNEDPDRFSADLVITFASVASLAAVVLTLVDAGNERGVPKTLLIVTSVVSVVLSWIVVHTAYTLRYARLYYDDCDGGIDFNSDEKPTYLDFAYLAFTVGMTFQVSDTAISDRRIRSTVLHQAVVAYVFGTVIVATTVNFVAGLGK